MTNLNDFKPDIESLAENAYLGPQAEVLEMIETFNKNYIKGYDTYNRYYYDMQVKAKPIGITKKFYWKPGAYPTIRQIVNGVQRTNKKAQTLTKVVSRARDYGYSMRNLQRDVSNIESKLFNFRNRGIMFQDNTNDIIEYWNLFYNKMLEQVELCSDFALFRVDDVRDIDDNIIDHTISVIYNYHDPKIKYKIASQDDVLAEIECPGIVQIVIKMSVCKIINVIASNNGSLDGFNFRDFRNNNSAIRIGGNYYNDYGLQHPYIASNSRSWNTSGSWTDDWKYVCVGNIDQEIQGCINSLDFLSLKLFIDRLVTHYDTQTGPLNRISNTYYGQPNFLEGETDYYNIVSRLANPHSCNYTTQLMNMADNDLSPEQVKEESYCNKYCTIKSKCNAYKDLTETYSAEDLERMAIEKATLNAATRR